MKKYFAAAAAALCMLTACENHKAELDSSNRERDSLIIVLTERDSTVNDFLQSYTEIQVGLDSVARRGTNISQNLDKQGELKPTTKQRINDNIIVINEMMKENREKVAELSRKLRNSSNKNAKLEKMIESLNSQMAQKDIELVALNEKLVSLNANVAQLQISVDTLTTQTNAQSQTIAEQTASLHTAYYVIGKSKELEAMKVIDKTGGVLGMGKSSKLHADFDNSNFTRIDYTQVISIDINSEAKIITSHPSDSYTLNKDSKDKDKINSITISNPEKFWSASKYLIIVKN
jgi:predicted  nucleic acid-binding Zn-ribbon protein